MIAIMYDHKGKRSGFIISVIGLILMIAERFTGFVIISKLTPAQHYEVFEWIMLLGLTAIIYSKEKIDDDRAKMIRLKSLQVSFLMIIAILLSIGFVSATSAKFSLEPGVLFMIAALGIIMYLLIFHLGLYFDFLVEYNDLSVGEDFGKPGKPRWGVLAYFICVAVSIILMFLF